MDEFDRMLREEMDLPDYINVREPVNIPSA
jgi:hypothetical protein